MPLLQLILVFACVIPCFEYLGLEETRINGTSFWDIVMIINLKPYYWLCTTEAFWHREEDKKEQEKEKLGVQNDGLQQVSKDLLLELGKRYIAVEEAVALICDLEARID